jgi:hypothetical protein
LINHAARQRLHTTHPVHHRPTNDISMTIAFAVEGAQGSRMTLVALQRKTIKTSPGWALEVSVR